MCDAFDEMRITQKELDLLFAKEKTMKLRLKDEKTGKMYDVDCCNAVEHCDKYDSGEFGIGLRVTRERCLDIHLRYFDRSVPICNREVEDVVRHLREAKAFKEGK